MKPWPSAKKRKNRLTLDQKEYLWWVFDETDQMEFDGIQIKVVAADQSHFFKYGLQQRDGQRKVAFALRDYKQLVHLTCPKIEDENGIITKSGVTRLIRWCKKPTHEISYALDGGNNQLSEEEQAALLIRLQKMIA